MTPFHLMAYEQLASQQAPALSTLSPRSTDPPLYDKDDWDLLPHMTYSNKNGLGSKVQYKTKLKLQIMKDIDEKYDITVI